MKNYSLITYLNIFQIILFSYCIVLHIRLRASILGDSSVNTPKDLVKFKISDSPITPLPDYGKMMTPEIKEALKRIGVKALPRKKAVAVLSHIYDETHPCKYFIKSVIFFICDSNFSAYH